MFGLFANDGGGDMTQSPASATCLFITHSFPAFGSANSLCDEELIRCRAQTSDVVVLCYRFPGQARFEQEGNITVYRIVKDEFWWIEKKTRSAKGKRFDAFLAKVICRLRQFLYLPLFPQYDPVAAIRISRRATKLIRRLGVRLVFADFNGCDTLLGGLKSAKKTNTPFFPIFWDAMSLGVRSRYVSKKYNDKRKKNLERRVILASRCSFFLKPHQKRMLAEYAGEDAVLKKMRFIELPVAFSSFEFPSPNEYVNPDGKIKLLYGGALSHRNFEPLLNAVVNGKNQDAVEMDFYFTASSEKDLKAMMKFNFIHVHSTIPSADFEKKCLESNVLIAAGVDNPVLPVYKLYRLISLGKPLIYLCRNPQDCMLDLVKKYPLSYIIYENHDDRPENLMNFLLDNMNRRLDGETIRKLLINCSPCVFWDLLKTEGLLEAEEE